mmetsp:Transcript_86399/g.268496  ORF Transcript_86399/g.268496 Transcript_86399/m.268496 type:complete len:392 (+) Transcript_86399:946-2121(+)
MDAEGIAVLTNKTQHAKVGLQVHVAGFPGGLQEAVNERPNRVVQAAKVDVAVMAEGVHAQVLPHHLQKHAPLLHPHVEDPAVREDHRVLNDAQGALDSWQEACKGELRGDLSPSPQDLLSVRDAKEPLWHFYLELHGHLLRVAHDDCPLLEELIPLARRAVSLEALHAVDLDPRVLEILRGDALASAGACFILCVARGCLVEESLQEMQHERPRQVEVCSLLGKNVPPLGDDLHVARGFHGGQRDLRRHVGEDERADVPDHGEALPEDLHPAGHQQRPPLTAAATGGAPVVQAHEVVVRVRLMVKPLDAPAETAPDVVLHGPDLAPVLCAVLGPGLGVLGCEDAELHPVGRVAHRDAPVHPREGHVYDRDKREQEGKHCDHRRCGPAGARY